MLILVLFIPCTVQCPNLSDPLNGVLDMRGRSTGSTATYTCNIGFELSGADILTCQDNATWDNPPPNCVARIIGKLTLATLIVELMCSCT